MLCWELPWAWDTHLSSSSVILVSCFSSLSLFFSETQGLRGFFTYSRKIPFLLLFLPQVLYKLGQSQGQWQVCFTQWLCLNWWALRRMSSWAIQQSIPAGSCHSFLEMGLLTGCKWKCLEWADFSYFRQHCEHALCSHSSIFRLGLHLPFKTQGQSHCQAFFM